MNILIIIVVVVVVFFLLLTNSEKKAQDSSDNERKLKITKAFASAKRLWYDVLVFKDSDGSSGKYFVLYEEDKLYSVDRPLIILETYYDSWGEKKYYELDQKARKLIWSLPFEISFHQTRESYQEVQRITSIKQEDVLDESRVEAIRNLSNPNEYNVYGLISDWDSSKGIKSYWYVLGKKDSIQDESEPIWLILYGNNEYPTTKQYAENRLHRIFSHSNTNLEIVYPDLTYDEVYEIKKQNRNIGIL